MTNIVVIGLNGAAGSGKSTAAHYLVEAYGFTRLPMAGALKEMAAVVLSPRQLDGDLKEVEADELGGMTPRRFMQLLGTEFGRIMVGPNFWVDIWKNRVREKAHVADLHRSQLRVVCDDVRFGNEAEAVRAMGGKLIHIDRPGAGSKTGGGHSSEGQKIACDATVRNVGGVDFYLDEVDRVVAALGLTDQ